MRITKTEISSLKAPLIMPFRIATGQHNTLDNLLFTITLEDGTRGYGEAAVATHITGETIAGTKKNLIAFSRRLKGSDPSDYLMISSQAHAFFKNNKAAVCAVEMAVLDALTRRMNMPLWRLWTDKPQQVTTDITLVIASLEETQQAARHFYSQGFRAFKIKIGRDVALDIARIKAVASLTRGSLLILDANQGYSATTMLKFLKQLEKAGVRPTVLEQPVPKSDVAGLKRVNRLAKVLVCADESARSMPEVLRLIEEKSVGAINIKLMKTGIVQSVAIAQWAHARGIKLMIGGMMESSLAMTCAAHVAAGMNCFDFVDLDTPFFIKNGLANNPYLSSRGVYDVSKVKSGIGNRPRLKAPSSFLVYC